MAVICSADDPEKLACWFEEVLRGPLWEKCCGAMGDPCAEMGDIGIPYRQALSALQYGAYFPDKSFYRYEETSSWDQNTNIDRRRMDDFLEQLAVCNSADAAACLEELRRLICETPLSWQSCTQIVGEALLALEKVAENNHVDLSELFTVSLPDQLGQLFYLDEMFRALEDAAEAILRHIQRGIRAGVRTVCGTGGGIYRGALSKRYFHPGHRRRAWHQPVSPLPGVQGEPG